MSFAAGAWSSVAFLIFSSLLTLMGSSLFRSIFISQASLSPLLEEGDDMMPSLENPDRKQLETRTEEICVIWESKPSGGYIMNFYRPKYVTCKKTESERHTRCSRGRGAPRGVGRAHHPRGALVSFLDCYLFFYFSKYSKMEKYCLKNCFGVGLLTVPHTYSFSESKTVWKVSLMYSFGVTVSIILVSTFMGLPEI